MSKELPYVLPYKQPDMTVAHPIKKGLYKIKSLGIGKALHTDSNNDKKVSE